MCNGSVEKKNTIYLFISFLHFLYCLEDSWEEKHRKLSHECFGASCWNSLEHSEKFSVNSQILKAVWLHYITDVVPCELALTTLSFPLHTHLSCQTKDEILHSYIFFTAHLGQTHILSPASWPHLPDVDGRGFLWYLTIHCRSLVPEGCLLPALGLP